MAIVQGIVTSFRKEILQGYHVFTSGAAHTFKMALYSSSATLDITTTAYTSTGEVSAIRLWWCWISVPTRPVRPVISRLSLRCPTPSTLL
jgi:hypothetical protein